MSLFRKIIVLTALFPVFLNASLLDLLELEPSIESMDYCENKKQFQLHGLVTEQRHLKTWSLSQLLQEDTKKGLDALFSVDEDISEKCRSGYDLELLEQASSSIEEAIVKGDRIYLYGCGATGRLAKQVESCFWRPFWKKMQDSSYWGKLQDHFPNIENRLIGEMTGADRALISSLEGLEDLQLIGRLQLKDHGITKDDVVFAITEGGETSSVIGTILAAAEEFVLNPEEGKNHLYFVYNNPNEVLLPLERSSAVLENPAISKICLFTGPQAITGSTRMQATTSETFIMGMLLEDALSRVLSRYLSEEELLLLGFKKESLKEKVTSFSSLQKLAAKTSSSLARLTDLESGTYRDGHFSTYFAKEAMIPVFIDSTERSPTFRLFPLDPCNSPSRKSLIQVWTPAKDQKEAWASFLGRPFKGLLKEKYEKPFREQIEDPFLQKAAERSLKNAGDDQQDLYDFSPNFNLRGPQKGDLGILVLLAKDLENLEVFQEWLRVFSKEAHLGVVLVDSKEQRIQELSSKSVLVSLEVGEENDPLGVRQQIALKMVLNAHSTAVMGKLGKIVGNTMTNVNPGNLKLIGRATYLIQSHVNSKLALEEQLSYAEANALLFDAIDYSKAIGKTGVYSEVALSIIRLLEAYRKQDYASWGEAQEIFDKVGLEGYLESF